MNVCICAQVSEERIVHAIRSGASTLVALRQESGAGTGCGDCTEMLLELLEDNVALIPAQGEDPC